MKKTVFLIILLIVAFSNARSQEGFTYLTLKTGPLYKSAWTSTIGLDLTTKYHNSAELSVTYYKVDNKSYDNLLLGMFYKPVLARSKNTTFKFRLGTHIGTDNSEFILSALGGMEFIQSLAPGFDFVISNTSGYYFWARNHWRVSTEFGFRISL
ncbi:MAG: hypothetical protein ACK5M7_09220 [Draconibacterium sp.]